jgi:hypothetical protein
MRTWLELDSADEQRVASFMARLAQLPIERAMSDPAGIWLKAQLLRRWEAERRAQAPLDMMDWVEIAGGLVTASFLFYWSIPYLF